MDINKNLLVFTSFYNKYTTCTSILIELMKNLHTFTYFILKTFPDNYLADKMLK